MTFYLFRYFILIHFLTIASNNNNQSSNPLYPAIILLVFCRRFISNVKTILLFWPAEYAHETEKLEQQLDQQQ
jgi:hypothetical protein